MSLNIEDYKNAPSGDGPLAHEWRDKPHRLVYDLCTEVERLSGDPDINNVPVLQTEELIINGELVTVKPMRRERLTKKRLKQTYNQGGKLVKNGGTKLAPFQRVYSVGATPEQAIHALGVQVGWKKIANFAPQECDEDGGWYYRFTEDGTSMKAGGRYVPGGCLVDWWK